MQPNAAVRTARLCRMDAIRGARRGLRSRESAAAVPERVSSLSLDGYLFNCTTPEAVLPAMKELRALTDKPLAAT